jgi:GMP synthase-like glutamine amidotransferase
LVSVDTPQREHAVIVNTHPGENPEFVDELKRLITSLGVFVQVADGYGGANPLARGPGLAILTGVPLEASYSLAEAGTQQVVADNFAWLRSCTCPVLGICYGHQILAHIFAGRVASLEKKVLDERYELAINPGAGGIFAGVQRISVFAEHRDYVSVVPDGFEVLAIKNNVPYVIYHPAREMYGFQFVPERSDGATKDVLARFVDLVRA